MKTQNVNLNEPSTDSQNGQILEYLRSGETITSLESLQLFGCFRCASRISFLRTERNYPIGDVTIEVKSYDRRKKQYVTKRVSAYYIPSAFAEKHGVKQDEGFFDTVRRYATTKAQHAFESEE